MRKRFTGVKLIIIDEISFVSDNMLTLIHERLCTVAGNDDFLGNFNILVVGDLLQLS